MPWSRLSGSISSPKVDVAIDMGNPFLNLTLDGFLKIGTVAATRSAAEDTYHILRKGNVSRHNFEDMLKKMCKEGAYWGAVAGLYVGTEYGVERIRGTRDWARFGTTISFRTQTSIMGALKNAMIGGAMTGAVVSAAGNNKKDRIVMDAITGAAIATAAEFINYLT